MISEKLAEREDLTEVPQRLALARLSVDTMGNTSQLLKKSISFYASFFLLLSFLLLPTSTKIQDSKLE
jgi:hypothetical protein